MTLTNLEKAVLRCLFESAKGNGHDFGFIEDGRSAVGNKNQLSGIIASLVKKNIIFDHRNARDIARATQHEVGSQFTWIMSVEDVEKLLTKE